MNKLPDTILSVEPFRKYMKLTYEFKDIVRDLPSDLSSSQIRLLIEESPPPGAQLRKYTVTSVINAILYLVKTGCQWRMLPPHYPKWRTVYNHFRSWGERGWFQTVLLMLVFMRRRDIGRNEYPSVGIIDSQSIRQVLPQSQKGVDGYKNVKGIKRHIVTDSQGYPLTVVVTTANVSDAKSVYPVVFNAMEKVPSIRLFKADKGYRGALEHALPMVSEMRLECVKSNFGKSQFIPLQGRWVVERTFSWLGGRRRTNCNYERYLHTARQMITAACMMFMLRYF